MAESIESLGDLIKEQARKYRKFNERISDCEVKLFGAPRDEKKRKQKVVSKENMNSSNLN